MERVDRELRWQDAVELARKEGLDYNTFQIFYDAVDKESDEKFCADYVDKWFTANFKPGYRRGIKWYRFPKLEAGFVRAGSESLQWLLRLYHTIEVTVATREGGVEGIYWDTCWDMNRSWLTPISLLKAWLSGELECGEASLISTEGSDLTYFIEDVEYIPKAFYRWFTGLGEEPIRKLLHLRVVDDLTYKALQKALLEAELPIDHPHKDKERLLTIMRFDKPLTYSEWGRVLGLTREGAYYLLRRFEAKGLVKLTKCERGVKAEVKTP